MATKTPIYFCDMSRVGCQGKRWLQLEKVVFAKKIKNNLKIADWQAATSFLANFVITKNNMSYL